MMRASEALDRGLADIITHAGDGLTRFTMVALDLLQEDLVSLARSYSGETIRGSVHRTWCGQQATIGGNEQHGEIAVAR